MFNNYIPYPNLLSNLSTYMNPELKSKMDRIKELCNVSYSKAIQTILTQMPEQYLIDLINTYKEQK